LKEVNIAHALMRGMEWRSCELSKPANEEIGVKLYFKRWKFPTLVVE
jgi:hypothetical protein